MNPANIDKLVSEALAIEAEAAREAGALGFMARALVQATMPHSKTAQAHFKRTNGDYSLVMTALDPELGLPYGSIPRLMLAWIGTEAIRTRERELVLGDSMSAFMRELGLVPTGGRWGSITRLKDQSRRLLRCAIACSYSNPDVSRDAGLQFMVADAHDLWWTPTQPDQGALFKSTLTLSERFFNEIIEHPVPIDMRALKALKRSPMALDIYCWATYRASYLKRATEIPWPALQAQFGSGYPLTPQGLRDFKKKFLHNLKSVLAIYPDAQIEPGDTGLLIKPAPTHISA